MSAFANQVALITGAGSGLGRQLSLSLAAEGAAVAAVDVNAAALAALEADLKGKPFASAVGDVTDRVSLRAAVAQVRQALGPIDLLFANAGIGRATTALNFQAEAVEAQVRVNLIGVANSIEMVLPEMIQRRRGHLVGISSLASYRGLPKLFGYCATKSGVNALLEGLRVELRPLGIAVTTVCPGWVRTPLTEGVGVPERFLMEVDVAVRRILKAVERRRAFYAFPGTMARRLSLLRLLPCGISDWMVRRSIAKMVRKGGGA